MTFCWLPPDRLRTGAPGLGVGSRGGRCARTTNVARGRGRGRPVARSSSQTRDRDVEGDGLEQQEAVRLAVLGQEPDAEGDGVARRADADGTPSMTSTVPASIGSAPWIARRTSVRPDPARPGDPEDLALAHLEADVARRRRRGAGPGRPGVGSPAGVGSGRLPSAVDRVDLTTDHQSHESLGSQVGGRSGGHDAAVLHDGHAVGDPVHLVEPMRDVDEGDALLGQPAHDPEQALQLGVAEHCRRLVEHDEPCVTRERLGDLDHLSSRDAERCRRVPAGQVQAEPLGDTRVSSISRRQSTSPRRSASAAGP